MSKENVIKFEEKVMQEKELQEKLEAAAKAYEGDKTDEKAVFEAVIVPVAKEAGLEFTYEEAIETKKEVQEGEIDLKEMKAVAGGGLGICLFAGYGKGAGGCLLTGTNIDRDAKGRGFGGGIGYSSCDGLGFGFGFGGWGD